VPFPLRSAAPLEEAAAEEAEEEALVSPISVPDDTTTNISHRGAEDWAAAMAEAMVGAGQFACSFSTTLQSIRPENMSCVNPILPVRVLVLNDPLEHSPLVSHASI